MFSGGRLKNSKGIIVLIALLIALNLIFGATVSLGVRMMRHYDTRMTELEEKTLKVLQGAANKIERLEKAEKPASAPPPRSTL